MARHRYDTRGIVLARTHTGEANTLLALLTSDVGLVQARAQSVRKSGAKLAPALVTLAESRVVLVRGKEGWRLAGAVLEESWFKRLQSPETRAAAVRVSGLVLRLVAGEVQDTELLPIMRGFLEALATLPADMHDAVEILAVLQILAALGLDAGEVPEGAQAFASSARSVARERRAEYVARINQDIAASGL